MTERKKLFRFRNIWMGLAMLWILFLHLDISCPGMLGFVKIFGYGGVDIFLFASGIGNYCSYCRDNDPLQFLRRRILRLAPVYVPFILIWLAWHLICGKLSGLSIVGNLFAIQGFTANGGEFNWYLTGLLLCYILTPYLALFLKEHDRKQNILLVLLLVVLSSAFWKDTRMIISVARLPVYTAGMLFARSGEEPVTNRFRVCLTGMLLAGGGFLLASYKFAQDYLWDFGLYWYPFLLITPPLCMLISEVLAFTESRKTLLAVFRPLQKLLALVGESSFEIYLLHVFSLELVDYAVENGILHDAQAADLAAAAAAIGVGILLHRARAKQCGRK